MAASVPDLAFHGGQRVRIEEQFHGQGLQIIVKLASIELSPTDPAFLRNDWCIEGTCNERIVGVGMLCYSVENIDGARLAFRHIGGLDSDTYDYDYDDIDDMQQLFELQRPENSSGDNGGGHFLNSQRLGSVAIKLGRLLAYPNHLQTRLEHVELQDKSKPGHIRYLVLCLVDPHYRICSTRNVEPQQPEYWVDTALQGVVPRDISLPQEIRDSIAAHVDEGWPVATLEAIALAHKERELPDLVKVEKWGICDC